MINPHSSPAFEQKVRAALATPSMRPEFTDSLRKQIALTVDRKEKMRPFFRRPILKLAVIVTAVLILSVLVIGPQHVLAQVLDWLGYVPGVGFVQTQSGLRVLEAPVSVERDGLTLTVRQGLVDGQNTHLSVLFEGIRQEQIPSTEDVPGCSTLPHILLPDSSELASGEASGGSGPTWWQLEITYPAIPADINDVTLVAPCVLGTLAGVTPENLRLELHFVPAPEDLQVLPVLPLPSEDGSGTGKSPQPEGMQLSVEEIGRTCRWLLVSVALLLGGFI